MFAIAGETNKTVIVYQRPINIFKENRDILEYKKAIFTPCFDYYITITRNFNIEEYMLH